MFWVVKSCSLILRMFEVTNMVTGRIVEVKSDIFRPNLV
jgi:hypothetical protein